MAQGRDADRRRRWPTTLVAATAGAAAVAIVALVLGGGWWGEDGVELEPSSQVPRETWWSEAPVRGHLVVIELARDQEWAQVTGSWVPADSAGVGGATWWVLDDAGQTADGDRMLEDFGPLVPGESGGEDARPGVRVVLASGQWSVRACGLDVRAPGEVRGGRARVDGVWRARPDPDAGTGCAESRWSDPDFWTDLWAGAPQLWLDGTGLVVVGESGAGGSGIAQRLVSVAMAPVGASAPQAGPPATPDRADLAAVSWTEVGVERAEEEIGGERHFIEVNPSGTGAITFGAEAAMGFDAACRGPHALLPGLLLPPAAQAPEGAGAVVVNTGLVAMRDCVRFTEVEADFWTTVLTRAPTVTMHGDYLVFDVWLEESAIN